MGHGATHERSHRTRKGKIMNVLNKTLCMIMSLICFACPIYSNANYQNSLLEVHAEDTNVDWLDSDKILFFICASLGLSITTKSPEPYKWISDEFKKYIKKYDDDLQERLLKAKADMRAREGQPIFEIDPALYNAISDFISNYQETKGLTSKNNVEIGVSSYNNSSVLMNANDIVFDKNGLFAFSCLEGSGYFYCQKDQFMEYRFMGLSNTCKVRIYKLDNKGKVIKYSDYSSPSYPYTLSGIDGKVYYPYYINYDSFGYGTDWTSPPYTTINVRGDVYLNDYILGNKSLTIDDKVIGAGDLKLDDRVLGTDEKATLDLTKVNFGQGVGVDATIADLAKWLTGTIANDKDLDWGKVIPLPDVKPIPIPEPTTEPLPTTEPIPTTEPVPTPFPPGDIDKYQTPSLTNVFPFCVPYDVVKFFGVLNAEPIAPKWTFDLNNFSEGYKFSIDMKDYETIIVVFRYGMLGLFIIGLILITRYIVGGQ